MKKQRIKSLTWKYFWEQKFREIFVTILIFSIIIFIPYFLGNSIGDGKDTLCANSQYGWDNDYEGECGLITTWFEGLFYSVIIVLILLLLVVWIQGNWEKAKEKAKEELKRQVKPKRRKTTHRRIKRR